MSNYPCFIKSKLTSIINGMSLNKDQYVRNPKSDFTRKRKISFETVLNLLISMGGSNLNSELLNYYSFNTNTPTSSAFVQQRNKVLPKALEHIFNVFTQSFNNLKTYDGYRLLAFDGSDLHIHHNPKNPLTYCQTKVTSRGYNLLHLNTMYDLKNKMYLDAIIQPIGIYDEHKALISMIDRSQIKRVLCIVDRGLESYNNIAHMDRKGWKYLARVKGPTSNGILKGLKLPSSDEFDVEFNLILTRKLSKVRANSKLYKYIHHTSSFSYFDEDKCHFYPFSFRVVRVQIEKDVYHSFITNLPTDEFPKSKIKMLYHMRWGIETSFRELKYSIGLTAFHAKKMDSIFQEIFARLTMYNFCAIITLHTIIKQKLSNKHYYQINFTQAIYICKRFFSWKDENPPDVETLIKRYVQPIRLDRKFSRNVKKKSFISFIYRIA
ncbi:IS4 family transposase [Clostridium sp. 'deep sea']|nr:IS4 family transposase [Clostridium sp. 'deep sea']